MVSDSRRRGARRLALALLAAAASIPMVPTTSPACSSAGDAFEVLPADQASAGEPPGPVTVVDGTTQRGRGETPSGCGQSMSTSCDDIGTIRLAIEPATDPDSLRKDVGYVVELASGTPPEGLGLHAQPQAEIDADGDPSLLLSWIDGSTDDQEAFTFAVTVRAIDVDGHMGPPSEPFTISDPGR